MTEPMGLTLERFADEMRPFANDICVVFDMRLGRLVGVCETEDDFYYVVRELGKGEQLYSAVGPCVSLKGRYPEDAYQRLEDTFAVNNAAPADTFKVERR